MPRETMPFGKYKDEPIETLPTGYIEWCLRELHKIDRWLRVALEQEYQRRIGLEDMTPESHPPPVDFAGTIARLHREMAMRFHPDRGGSNEAMKVVNVVMDRLKELVKAS